MKSANIGVRFSVTGQHHWPDATYHRRYLQPPHDHVFGVQVEMAVEGDDRTVEFHDLREGALAALLQGHETLPSGKVQFGGQSCEMIARGLAKRLALAFRRDVKVTVDEDGQCWATVEEAYE